MWSEGVWSEGVWREGVWRGCGGGVEGGGKEGEMVCAQEISTNPSAHTYTTDRSTVEFAREVAETKAMDDALNRLDEMIGSSGSHDNFTSPHMGSSPPQGRDHSISSSVLHLAR